MSTDRPDPGEFFERAQEMLRGLLGGAAEGGGPWGSATGERSATSRGNREPSAEEQRQNLTFALATRAVEALEDLALNVAAIRQRLERVDAENARTRPEGDDGAAEGPGLEESG